MIYSNNNFAKKIKKGQTQVFFIAICSLILACSQTLEFVTAITSLKSTTAIRTVVESSAVLTRQIARGGSIEKSNNSKDGDENEGNLEAVTTAKVEEDDEDTRTPEIRKDESSSLTEIAKALRLDGKKYHDEGDFIKAAEVFQNAADTFLGGDNTKSSTKMSEDYATCRLHQALCHLKSENYELCIDACTDVLQDNVNNKSNAKSDLLAGGSTHLPAINARAYHRRAKAKMALGDNSGALQDARTASFLGDGKAVALYGKLMRKSSSTDLSAAINPLISPDSYSSSVSPHAALLESLMNKSSENASSSFSNFSPASLLLGNGNGGSGINMLGALGSGGGGLAKSVLQNLSKKLDDESTQETICNYLQQTSKAQIQNLASMGGIDNVLQDSHLDRLVNFCHGITPKGIRRMVRTTKVVVYIAKVIRRTAKLISKYKSLLAVIFIMQWAKCSIFRPMPIDKRAAKKVAKQALKEAMKASRAGFF